MTVHSKLVDITPDLAREWLELNTENFRNVDLSRVKRYAKDMTAGRWDVTGDTIKFTPDGLVADGQHRLHACVEAGVDFVSLVVWGVQGVANVDRGQPRTVAQWLRHLGFANCKSVAAVSKLALMYEKNLWHHKSWQSHVATDSEVIAFAQKHNTEIQDSLMLARNCKAIPQTLLATILAIGSGPRLPSEEPIAVWFAKGLSDGSDLTKSDAALHLRNRFLTESRSNKSSVFMKRVVCSKAWNMTVRGEPCSSSQQLMVRLTGPAQTRPIKKLLCPFEFERDVI